MGGNFSGNSGIMKICLGNLHLGNFGVIQLINGKITRGETKSIIKCEDEKGDKRHEYKKYDRCKTKHFQYKKKRIKNKRSPLSYDPSLNKYPEWVSENIDLKKCKGSELFKALIISILNENKWDIEKDEFIEYEEADPEPIHLEDIREVTTKLDPSQFLRIYKEKIEKGKIDWKELFKRLNKGRAKKIFKTADQLQRVVCSRKMQIITQILKEAKLDCTYFVRTIVRRIFDEEISQLQESTYNEEVFQAFKKRVVNTIKENRIAHYILKFKPMEKNPKTSAKNYWKKVRKNLRKIVQKEKENLFCDEGCDVDSVGSFEEYTRIASIPNSLNTKESMFAQN